jgi:hypothetical protein
MVLTMATQPTADEAGGDVEEDASTGRRGSEGGWLWGWVS